MGIHEGPCLAVTLNDRQDYFGQTVNIASRVQGLAASRSILATGQVVENPQAFALLEAGGLKPMPRRASLRGIADQMLGYQIPYPAIIEPPTRSWLDRPRPRPRRRRW